MSSWASGRMSDQTMPRLLFLYFARTSRLTSRPRSSRWSNTSTSDIQVPRPSELSRPMRRNGSLTTRTPWASLRSGISHVLPVSGNPIDPTDSPPELRPRAAAGGRDRGLCRSRPAAGTCHSLSTVGHGRTARAIDPGGIDAGITGRGARDHGRLLAHRRPARVGGAAGTGGCAERRRLRPGLHHLGRELLQRGLDDRGARSRRSWRARSAAARAPTAIRASRTTA